MVPLIFKTESLEIIHIKPADCPQMPWKNGKGSTSQIAIYPADASLDKNNFLWRISSAIISESGQFSNFTGYQRLLTLIDGHELALNFENAQKSIVLTGDSVHCFSGDEFVSAEVTQGPIKDLGLIFNPNWVQAEMKLANFGPTEVDFYLTAKATFFYVASGTLKVHFKVYPQALLIRKGEVLRINKMPSKNLLHNSPHFLLSHPEREAKIIVTELNWN